MWRSTTNCLESLWRPAENTLHWHPKPKASKRIGVKLWNREVDPTLPMFFFPKQHAVHSWNVSRCLWLLKFDYLIMASFYFCTAPRCIITQGSLLWSDDVVMWCQTVLKNTAIHKSDFACLLLNMKISSSNMEALSNWQGFKVLQPPLVVQVSSMAF